jgi:transketolase
MYSDAATAMAKRLGLRMGKANLEAMAATVLELAKADRNVLVVTSDSRGSGKLGPYGQALPEQIVEVGIAEQNLVGIAAGLASAGKTVFAVSPACFLTARALEQIKNDVAYTGNLVRCIGISAGVSYGALGSTHHSLHDFAALRAINNIDVIAPADNIETQQIIRTIVKRDVPTYVRFGKAPLYDLHTADAKIEVGKASVLRDGNDVAFIATGEAVAHALLAAGQLADESISAKVISLHSIKPIDREAILAAASCGTVITVEEHSLHGGIGEAVAGLLMDAGKAVKFKAVGIPDEHTVTGSQADIFRHYGITMEGLAATANALLRR